MRATVYYLSTNTKWKEFSKSDPFDFPCFFTYIDLPSSVNGNLKYENFTNIESFSVSINEVQACRMVAVMNAK